MLAVRILDDVLGWATSLRVPLSLLGLAGSALFLYSLRGGYSPILMDYVVWCVFIASSLAAIGDLRRHSASAGYASTLSLDILALTFLAAGRIGSIAHAMWTTSLQSPLVGGGATYPPSVALASLVALGGIWASAATVAHAALGRPVVLMGGEPYRATFGGIGRALASALRAVESRPVLSAFAIGLSIRLVPEIAWWPWPIGWDTFEYIARLNDFIAFPNPLSPEFAYGMRNYPPLLDVTLAVPGAIFGSWATFKAFPPIAYGALAALTALTSKRALRMSDGESLLAAAVSALFILNLRISWDYQKQILGTVLLMAALACIDDDGRLRRQFGVAALLVLASLASQITAVAAAPALLLLVIDTARSRRIPACVLNSAALASVISALAWYSGGFVWGNATFGAAPAGIVSTSLSSAPALIAYLFAGFGILLGPALLAARSYNKYYLAVIATLALAALSPIFMPYTAVTAHYRFLIQLAPLLSPLAIKGMLSIKRRHAVAAYSLAIVAIGCCFIVPGGQTYTYALTGAFIEFPPLLQPDPPYENLLTDLTNFSAGLGGMGLREDVPIITPYYLNRYVHLGILNPAPGMIISISSSNWQDVNRTVSALNLTSFYYFDYVDAGRFAGMLDSMRNSSSAPVTFSFSVLREGIYSLYEVNRSVGLAG